MSNQTDALDLVTHCLNVVAGEIQMLNRWKNEAGVGIGRAAACADSILIIGTGPISAKTRIDNVISVLSAAAPAEVVRPPAAHHVNAVRATESSQQARAGTFAASMSQLAFDDGLLTAEENANRTAANAELILLDCSSP
jgi:hypothetical protein